VVHRPHKCKGYFGARAVVAQRETQGMVTDAEIILMISFHKILYLQLRHIVRVDASC
jgi:hypothetical protein